MKKYYFDKIEIVSDSVIFISSSDTIGTINYAHTFRKFLSCLKQTKLQDSLQYDIICRKNIKEKNYWAFLTTLNVRLILNF